MSETKKATIAVVNPASKSPLGAPEDEMHSGIEVLEPSDLDGIAGGTNPSCVANMRCTRTA